MEDHEPVRIEGDTIVDAFRITVHRIPNRPALRRNVAGRWETLTWADYGRGVGEVTAGLAELGIEPGQQVGIFSNNRLEWHLADFGVLANGSVTVPLYQTSSAEQVAYMLGHARGARAFVENHELASRILEVRDRLPDLERIIVFDDDERLDDPFVVGFEQVRRSARRACKWSPICSTGGLTRSRPNSSRRSSTRAARPDTPKGR